MRNQETKVTVEDSWKGQLGKRKIIRMGRATSIKKEGISSWLNLV